MTSPRTYPHPTPTAPPRRSSWGVSDALAKAYGYPPARPVSYADQLQELRERITVLEAQPRALMAVGGDLDAIVWRRLLRDADAER